MIEQSKITQQDIDLYNAVQDENFAQQPDEAEEVEFGGYKELNESFAKAISTVVEFLANAVWSFLEHIAKPDPQFEDLFTKESEEKKVTTISNPEKSTETGAVNLNNELANGKEEEVQNVPPRGRSNSVFLDHSSQEGGEAPSEKEISTTPSEQTSTKTNSIEEENANNQEEENANNQPFQSDEAWVMDLVGEDSSG